MSDNTEITALTIRQPTAIVVASEADEAVESANLIVLRKARKAYEEKFKELRKPFEDGLAALKVEFAQVVDPIKKAEELCSTAVLNWKRAEQTRIDKEKRDAAAAHAAAERLAAQQNRPAPPPAPVVQEQAKGWATDQGSVGTRKVLKWKVVNETLIPYEIVWQGQTYKLWELVNGSITKIRNGSGDTPSPIPGIEFYTDITLGVK